MDQATLVRALASLGVQVQDIERLRAIPFPQAVEGLKRLQDEAKPRYKKLAFALHPDRTGGDLAKSKLFSEVTAANKWLQELKVEPPQPVMRIQMVHYPAARPFGGTVTSWNTQTSTGSANHYNASRVVFIKVG
jgi:hypothetical protein